MPPEQHQTHWTRDAVLGLISLVVLGVAVLLGVQIAQNRNVETVPSNNAQNTQDTQPAPVTSQDTQQPVIQGETTTSVQATSSPGAAGPTMPAPHSL